MPPKRQAADSTEAPSSSSDAPKEEKVEKKSDAAALSKPEAHPSTAIMVREALKELDSRKGVSSQAIQSYIKQKYPSIDSVRLKHLVRRALRKGIETGTLVRPANSNFTTGAMGRFRLPPKVKEAKKAKTENTDPNVQKEPKTTKDGAAKPKKAGTKKGGKQGKKETEGEQAKTKEDSKPAKKSKKDKAPASKPAAAKKPKAKKTSEKGGGEEASDSTKTKAAKTKETAKTAKEPKTGKASQSKAAKAGSDAPAPKAPAGKRGKKAAE
ncbi:protein B4 [Cheilinus undulatus]|uniref:protein B4 n=1 Tax=Cheilinus undulatus TaxID=241271 RepID=UPI001BD37714|nr:protein B4 [Cheilinus undulatus]